MNTSQTIQLWLPLVAVIIGGLLSITGGYVSTVLIERRRQDVQAKNLALAFRGEISALLHQIQTRNYAQRFGEIISQIEQSRQPFYPPYRIRYEYNSVYRANVDRIGTLHALLPEMIATFYTQLNSLLEDLTNLGDGVYSELDLQTLLRVYSDALRIIQDTQMRGSDIVRQIDRLYPRGNDSSNKTGPNMI